MTDKYLFRLHQVSSTVPGVRGSLVGKLSFPRKQNDFFLNHISVGGILPHIKVLKISFTKSGIFPLLYFLVEITYKIIIE